MIKAEDEGDKVIFKIIEFCDNLLEREQYWINYYIKTEYEVVNVFSADRNNSIIKDSFRDKFPSVSSSLSRIVLLNN